MTCGFTVLSPCSLEPLFGGDFFELWESAMALGARREASP